MGGQADREPLLALGLASVRLAVWDDVRGNQGDPALDRGSVLPFRQSRDEDDEKHLHPLQLDVITRAVTLWTNPGERVLTPFLGVGSEVYGAVRLGRFGIGAELKPSYYRQAVRNLEALGHEAPADDEAIFDQVP
jgi:DNA modification methylase